MGLAFFFFPRRKKIPYAASFFLFFVLLHAGPPSSRDSTPHTSAFPRKAPLFLPSGCFSPAPLSGGLKTRTSRARGNPTGTTPSRTSISPAPAPGHWGLIPILLLRHFQAQFPAFLFPCPHPGDLGMLQAGAKGGGVAGWPGKGRSQQFLSSACLSFPGCKMETVSCCKSRRWSMSS